MDDSGIFVRNKLTDFEKLLFAKKEIEDLKKESYKKGVEIGILKDELEFLKGSNLENLRISISALRKENRRLRKLINGEVAIKDTTWKSKYEGLFIEYMKLKNNV